MKSALLLLGSFAFGYNAATGFHELGHVLAAWLVGAEVGSVVLHPFGTSYADIDPSVRPEFTYAAGFVSAPVAAIGLLLLVWQRPSARVIPIHVLAVTALATTGIYLAVGVLTETGDAGDLIRLGVASGLLLIAGLVALAAALLLGCAVLPLAGLARHASLTRRLWVCEFAVLPYLGAILLYNLRREPAAIQIWGSMLAAGAGAAALLAVVSHLLSGRLGRFERDALGEPGWGEIGMTLALGAGIVALELWAA